MIPLLDQVLAEMRFSGGIFARCAYRGDWEMALAAEGPHMLFHVIEQGEAEFRHLGEEADPETVRLAPGDIVVLPFGDPHRLWRGTSTAAPPKVMDDAALANFAQLNHGRKGPATVFLCGYYRFERLATHPLLRLLPRVMHIRAGHDTRQIAALVSLIDREAVATGDGSRVLMDRLTESLLLYLLRAWTEQRQAPRGLFAALADPSVGRAIAAMHRAPEWAWTVAKLGREANASRAAFAKRFQQLLGYGPIAYLVQLRMSRAMDLLQHGRLSLARVAETAGYQSAAAFGKAFRKYSGYSPRRFRQIGRGNSRSSKHRSDTVRGDL
jgi:AraC-like DNA-binding protein